MIYSEREPSRMASKKETKARGAEIRRLRKRFNFDLEKLARLAKISVPMLSQVERGNRMLSPKARRRVLEAFDKEVIRRTEQMELLRRLRAARLEVAKCQLDMYRSGLPEAQKRCAEIEAQAGDALKDPIVRGLLESYEREVEQMKSDADMWMQAAMVFAVGYVEGLRGESVSTPWPEREKLEALHAEAIRQLKENNKITMPDYASVIDKVRAIMVEK